MVAMPWPVLIVAGWLAFEPTALEIPSDWKAQQPPPYPNLLVSLRHRNEATLTIGRQFLGVGEDGESFARGNVPAMEKMGLVVQREGSEIRATSRKAQWQIRQAYVVKGSVGWVVTLAGAPSQLRGLARDFAAIVAQVRGP